MQKLIEIAEAAPANTGKLDDIFAAAPGATIMVKVPGGYMAFDNADEAQAFVKNPIVPAGVVRVPYVESVKAVEVVK